MQYVEELYAAYKNSVYRLALSYVGNIAEAEDITQTVFLKLCASSASISHGKERAWLLKVTYHECIEVFRRQKHFSDVPPPERIVENISHFALREALGKLSAEQRAVVHLFYYEGYSTRDIAKLLGIRQSCVTTRLQRARQRLKLELGGDTV